MKYTGPQHDPAYDAEYYRSYGIDPAEMGIEEKPKKIRKWPQRYTLDCVFDIWRKGEDLAIVTEEPNGPHPCAYLMHHRIAWEVYEVTEDADLAEVLEGYRPAADFTKDEHDEVISIMCEWKSFIWSGHELAEGPEQAEPEKPEPAVFTPIEDPKPEEPKPRHSFKFFGIGITF